MVPPNKKIEVSKKFHILSDIPDLPPKVSNSAPLYGSE
jgi:hypothetical protein